MDNNAHRDNGRPKPNQQWVMQHPVHPPSMKQIMALMAERDHAIQERNLALKDKKSALAERDMAIHQRDSAITERNKALMERENALSALQYRQNSIKSGVKSQFEEFSYSNSREIDHISNPFPLSPSPSPPPPEPPKPKKEKRAKEPEGTTTTSSNKKPMKKKVKKLKDDDEDYGGSKRPKWKDQNLSLNQITYDDSTMPVPVCSCTGVYRPCYKWGSGGWQSSCCTTTLSVYPLPPVPNKKHARIGGRKMSGGAFNKLLTRLAAEGHDLSNPVDLKDNWARHGTNRYITLK